MTESDSEVCIFCEIAAHRASASIVYEDALTLAFIDLRQANQGHTLVIPRAHCADVRELDPASGAALMATLTRITIAAGHAFPNQGFSIWHSIGPAAFQEVGHLHLHVHPRLFGDDLLQIYPECPANVSEMEREAIAAMLRTQLSALA